MLTGTELLLCLSASSVEWSVCWRGDYRRCGTGLFGSALPFASLAITLSSASMFLTPLTPAGGQETTLSVTANCCVSSASGWQECSTQLLDLEESPCWRKVGPGESAATSLWNQRQNSDSSPEDVNYLETTEPSTSLLKNNLWTSSQFIAWTICCVSKILKGIFHYKNKNRLVKRYNKSCSECSLMSLWVFCTFDVISPLSGEKP